MQLYQAEFKTVWGWNDDVTISIHRCQAYVFAPDGNEAMRLLQVHQPAPAKLITKLRAVVEVPEVELGGVMVTGVKEEWQGTYINEPALGEQRTVEELLAA